MELSDQRLPYEPPVVVRLGDFIELTQGGGASNVSDDGATLYYP